MGSDLYYEAQEADRRRGKIYTQFFKDVCDLLDLEHQWDVNGPGDDRVPSTKDVLFELGEEMRRD